MISAKNLKELSRSLNILYAEDEAILRDSLENTLGKLFQNVYVAKNGQEAIEIFKKECIDIVLTDINMPIMSGVELIAEINKTQKDPIIIVLSAHDEARLLKTLINMDVNNFINKPLEKDALIKILYKSCSLLNDKKMLQNYAQELESENEEIRRMNSILELKFKQLATQTNRLNHHKKTDVTPKGIFKKKKKEKKAEEISYYQTLLQDDKDELKDLAEELETTITMMFQNDSLNLNYIERLSNLYKKYSAILSGYAEFYEISITLTLFSKTIIGLEDKFFEDIEQTGLFFESLQLTFESFRKSTWDIEANNPKFYNASLNNDIQLIIDYLEGNEAEENEMEFF